MGQRGKKTTIPITFENHCKVMEAYEILCSNQEGAGAIDTVEGAPTANGSMST